MFYRLRKSKKNRGINKVTINVIKTIYENNINIIRVQNEESSGFQRKIILKQGCVVIRCCSRCDKKNKQKLKLLNSDIRNNQTTRTAKYVHKRRKDKITIISREELTHNIKIEGKNTEQVTH